MTDENICLEQKKSAIGPISASEAQTLAMLHKMGFGNNKHTQTVMHEPSEVGLLGDRNVCDICGKRASEIYELEMYCVNKRGYAPPFGISFSYSQMKFKVPCCDECYKSVNNRNGAVGIFLVIVWIALLILALQGGCDGVFQFVMITFLTGIGAAVIAFPAFFFFSGDKKLCRQAMHVKELIAQGWKLGKKPSKLD